MGKIAVVFVIAVALDCLCKAQNGQLFPRSGPYTCTSTTTCHPGIAPQPQDPVPSSSSRLLQGPPGKKGIPGSRGEKGRKGDPCQCDMADEEEIRGLREKMERLEAANQELKQSVALLQGAVQEVKSNITLLEEEDETLGEINRQLKSNISLLQRGNEELQATDQKLKQSVTLLQGAVQEVKSNITLLEEEDETLGEINRELKSNISLLQRGNEELQATDQKLKQSVALLQGAVQVAKSNITLLEEEDETLGEMNRELKSNISLLKRGNERLEATNLELKNNITLLRAIETNQWMVIQRRVDASVDFYRNWESYARGFGDVDGNYWIGLRNLHMLTNARSYKLRIDLMSWENERRYAEYSTFRVADEESKFRLTVSGYTGDAGDVMSIHNGELWSSFDRDNDRRGSGSCAVDYHGAWWYSDCYYANLNGKYFPSSNSDNKGVKWTLWERYSLKFVEMKIKPN